MTTFTTRSPVLRISPANCLIIPANTVIALESGIFIWVGMTENSKKTAYFSSIFLEKILRCLSNKIIHLMRTAPAGAEIGYLSLFKYHRHSIIGRIDAFAYKRQLIGMKIRFRPKRPKEICVSKSKERRIKYLEKFQVSRFFQAIPSDESRDRAMFDLIYRHGLRRVEATWLRKEWLSNGRIWIMRAKNSISQEYNLHPDSRKLIDAYLESRGEDSNPYLFIGRESGADKPISSGLVYQRFEAYAELAGIPADKRFVHTLRHSIAVHLLDALWDVCDVQDWLGHKDIKNTMVYAKISNKRREKQFKKLLKSSDIANTLAGLYTSESPM